MKSAKHIVLITPGFAKNEQDSTCIPTLQGLVNELRKKNDIQITIVAVHYPHTSESYEWNGVKVYPLEGNNVRGFQKISLIKKGLRKLKEIHSNLKIDQIQCFWLSDAAVIGSRFAKKNGIKCSITLMGQEALNEKKYLKLIRGDNQYVALSTMQKSQIEENLKLSIDEVIPFGIEEIELHQDKKRSIDILGVGSLIPLKNYEQLVRTVALLQSENQFKVELIGEGPEMNKLKELSEDLGAEITFLGQLEREEVLSKMRESKVLFHPSNYESFGYVFMEALACGMGIVSENVGCALDFKQENWTISENEDFGAAILHQLELSNKRKRSNFVTMRLTVEKYLKHWKV